MTQYILKRLLMAVPVFFGITLVAFFLLKSIPGDPVYNLIGERADAKTIEEYRNKYNLGNYGGYLKMILRGDMGYSYYTKEPVTKTFIKKFPNTLRLAFAAMLISIVFGTVLGIISAVKRNTAIDKVIFFSTTFGISLPVFWWGLILVIIFAYTFRIFPPSGMGRGELIYIVLPAVTLASRSIAYMARVARASMLEVLGQPYITSARARGVGRFMVIIKHGFRNALIPVVTLAALDMGSYLNGAVLTETIFNWNGIGRWAVNAIFKRDYPVILAVVLWGAIIFVVVNILVDLSYQFINPKMRKGNTQNE